jgi:hypothetical protein
MRLHVVEVRLQALGVILGVWQVSAFGVWLSIVSGSTRAEEPPPYVFAMQEDYPKREVNNQSVRRVTGLRHQAVMGTVRDHAGRCLRGDESAAQFGKYVC